MSDGDKSDGQNSDGHNSDKEEALLCVRKAAELLVEAHSLLEKINQMISHCEVPEMSSCSEIDQDCASAGVDDEEDVMLIEDVIFTSAKHKMN